MMNDHIHAPETSDDVEAIRALCQQRISEEKMAMGLNEEARQEVADGTTPPTMEELRFTREELEKAALHPPCIIESYLYADVAELVAPGGVGKTTLIIYELVHVALGLPLYGLEIKNTGWTLIVTAEDRREVFAARLREVMGAMLLTPEQREIVLDRFRLWDVSGTGAKLTWENMGNIELTGLADAIIKAYKSDPPILTIFDPAISFGANEGRVNDNEQALVTAARRLVRFLGCGVRYIHHTGKGNARDSTLDQYTSRGGSALPDGSRMVAVLQTWQPGGKSTLRPPQGCNASPDASISILARPKLSYAPPNLPHIWIKRTGFSYEHFTEIKQDPEKLRQERANQLERFLSSELKEGRHYNKTTLEASLGSLDMTRTEFREAIAELTVAGRVMDVDLPKEQRQGRKKTYLQPVKPAEAHGGINPKTE